MTGSSGTRNLDLVRSLGADKVIDYTKEGVLPSGETYDLIFDTVGKIPGSVGRAALSPGGKFVTTSQGMAKERTEDLEFLRELIDDGKLRAVIDTKFPLEQAAEAHRYVEKNHKRGNVVLTINQKVNNNEKEDRK